MKVTEKIRHVAEEYAKPFRGYDFAEAPATDVENAFCAGVEFAQQWTSVDDELPKEYETVLVKIRYMIDGKKAVDIISIGAYYLVSKAIRWTIIHNKLQEGYYNKPWIITHWRTIDFN